MRVTGRRGANGPLRAIEVPGKATNGWMEVAGSSTRLKSASQKFKSFCRI